ncbi:hypothetical protein EDB89DRAFT_273490 [Lactarius sanguifluus]|nr:hypothetical protein EDB89DRAFT_273490 [Lactarius sanguifluus]
MAATDTGRGNHSTPESPPPTQLKPWCRQRRFRSFDCDLVTFDSRLFFTRQFRADGPCSFPSSPRTCRLPFHSWMDRQPNPSVFVSAVRSSQVAIPPTQYSISVSVELYLAEPTAPTMEVGRHRPALALEAASDWSVPYAHSVRGTCPPGLCQQFWQHREFPITLLRIGRHSFSVVIWRTLWKEPASSISDIQRSCNSDGVGHPARVPVSGRRRRV